MEKVKIPPGSPDGGVLHYPQSVGGLIDTCRRVPILAGLELRWMSSSSLAVNYFECIHTGAKSCIAVNGWVSRQDPSRRSTIACTSVVKKFLFLLTVPHEEGYGQNLHHFFISH
jgi:hypothetical protein